MNLGFLGIRFRACTNDQVLFRAAWPLRRPAKAGLSILLSQWGQMTATSWTLRFVRAIADEGASL
jgi:hypothetical protein